MAAPNIETLLDFETNVEDAAQVFIATATGLSATSVNASLDQSDLVLPRIEVTFQMGEALDPPDQKKSGSSDLEYRKHTGMLTVNVLTRPTRDGSNADHRSYRAKVRSALLLNAANFSGEPDAQVVEGAGTAAANGVYLRDGDTLSLPRYTKVGGVTAIDTIESNGSFYIIGSTTLYISADLTDTPDLVSGWVESTGISPAPTVRRATWADIIAAGIDIFTVPLIAGGAPLPYYDVNYLRPTGTQHMADGDVAMSTLTYQMNLCIRNDAWPA